MKATIKSKQGFYIGDICYALSEEDYDEGWGNAHNYDNGCYEIRGHSFAVDSTKHGDGIYYDDAGKEYCVDVGAIGIVPRELCLNEELADKLSTLGQFVDGTTATMESHGGLFRVTVGETVITLDTRGIESREESLTFVDDEEYEVCEACHQTYPKTEMKKEVALGYLCDRCLRGIESRGESLTFEDCD